MSTTPLSSTILAHFYTKNEKFNIIKTVGILIGFSGIVFLFSDNLISVYIYKLGIDFTITSNNPK